MTLNRGRKAAIVSIKLLVIVLVLVAAGIALHHPECRAKFLTLSLEGAAAGLSFALVRILDKLDNPNLNPREFSAKTVRCELRAGLVGGTLLGLAAAVIFFCWFC